jgi:toxin ParE1/3/4
MTRRWIVRPLAESDLDHAAHWYDDQRPGLGLQFLDTVDQVFERIRVTPLQFPTVWADVRRALLHTFPYAVYFRVTDDTILVFAVLHLRRDPRTWRDRS